jgi:hypothetical protein
LFCLLQYLRNDIIVDDYVPTTWVTKRWMGAPVPVPQAASSGLSDKPNNNAPWACHCWAICRQLAGNHDFARQEIECVHIVGGTAKASRILVYSDSEGFERGHIASTIKLGKITLEILVLL